MALRYTMLAVKSECNWFWQHIATLRTLLHEEWKSMAWRQIPSDIQVYSAWFHYYRALFITVFWIVCWMLGNCFHCKPTNYYTGLQKPCLLETLYGYNDKVLKKNIYMCIENMCIMIRDKILWGANHYKEHTLGQGNGTLVLDINQNYTAKYVRYTLGL